MWRKKYPLFSSDGSTQKYCEYPGKVTITSHIRKHCWGVRDGKDPAHRNCTKKMLLLKVNKHKWRMGGERGIIFATANTFLEDVYFTYIYI